MAVPNFSEVSVRLHTCWSHDTRLDPKRPLRRLKLVPPKLLPRHLQPQSCTPLIMETPRLSSLRVSSFWRHLNPRECKQTCLKPRNPKLCPIHRPPPSSAFHKQLLCQQDKTIDTGFFVMRCALLPVSFVMPIRTLYSVKIYFINNYLFARVIFTITHSFTEFLYCISTI